MFPTTVQALGVILSILGSFPSKAIANSCVPAGIRPMALTNSFTVNRLAVTPGPVFCVNQAAVGGAIPTEYVFTIEPVPSTSNFTSAVYTVPTEMSNIVNILVDPSINQVVAGLDTLIRGAIPRFPQNQQPFGVVVQVPANDLNELIVVGDRSNTDFKVRLAPGFPNLSLVRITRNTAASGSFRTPRVTMEADWTTATSPVDLRIPNVGTYIIKGDVQNLNTSIADALRDSGPFELDLDGSVASLVVTRPGNYSKLST